MAKREKYKAKKREKKERQERRHDTLVSVIIHGTHREKIKSFSDEERWTKVITPNQIGYIACPLCGNKKVLVINSKGERGSSSEDRFKRHRGKASAFDCATSSQRVKAFAVM